MKKNLSRAISRNLRKFIFNFLSFSNKQLKIAIFGLLRVKMRRESASVAFFLFIYDIESILTLLYAIFHWDFISDIRILITLSVVCVFVKKCTFQEYKKVEKRDLALFFLDFDGFNEFLVKNYLYDDVFFDKK